jgi:ATP-binding cassette subfamily F protein uup
MLAFGYDEKGKKIIEPMVGLQQWEEWHAGQEQIIEKLDIKKETSAGQQEATPIAPVIEKKKKKLSFKDQRDLDNMESNIKKAEALLAELTAESLKPENSSNSKKLLELTESMARAQAEVDRLYARWAELE